MQIRNVPISRWGVGNEMVVVVQNEFCRFEGRSIVFDCIPQQLASPSLYDAGRAELSNLSDNKNDMLGSSTRLRRALAEQRDQLPLDSPWRFTVKTILSCWRALEIMLLETTSSHVRSYVVDWANDFHGAEEEEEHPFARGLDLLLRGKGDLASAEFQKLIPSRGPRMRNFFEVLCTVCDSLPTASNREEDWSAWQGSVAKLEDTIPEEDRSLVEVVKMLKGDVSVIVRHFQKKPQGCWPQLLAAILLFKAPLAKRSILGDLADRCVEPFNRREFDASRVALVGGGEAASRAISKLHDLDSWSECHMALVFGVKERDSLLFKFACQMGFGPGRVESRPVNSCLAPLALALDYLAHVSSSPSSPLLRRLILDRACISSSDRFARKVRELADAESLTVMSRVQLYKWMRVGSFTNARRWVPADLEVVLLHRILDSFHSSSPLVSDSESILPPAASGLLQAIQKLLVIRSKLLLAEQNGGDAQEVAPVLLDCIQDLPFASRIDALHAVLLFGNRPLVKLSVSQSLRVGLVVNGCNNNLSSRKSAELRALSLHGMCEAVRGGQLNLGV